MDDGMSGSNPTAPPSMAVSHDSRDWFYSTPLIGPLAGSRRKTESSLTLPPFIVVPLKVVPLNFMKALS